MKETHFSNEKAIFGLWLNWALSIGALALPELCSLVMPASWSILVSLIAIAILLVYRFNEQMSQHSTCELIQTICIRALAVSTLIMVFISIIYTRGIIFLFYPSEFINVEIPYLSILILAPSVTAICIYYIARGSRSGVCRHCILRYGAGPERGFLGKVFMRESHYQVRCLMYISIFLTVICWGYYTFYYINVNLNSADHFMFNWVPSIVFVFSLLILGIRYFSLWSYYFNQITLNPNSCINGIGIRYLIIHNNELFVKRNELKDTPSHNNLLDTAGEMILPHTSDFDNYDATLYFADISGLSQRDFSLRYMYKSQDLSGLEKVLHFICCLPSKETMEKSSLQGEWISFDKLYNLSYRGELDNRFIAEIYRLYTVSMTWKTYEISGRRRYRIKNYNPSFNLEGIIDWDVDFDNPKWLEVARFNEDKNFYRFRRLIHKYNPLKSNT